MDHLIKNMRAQDVEQVATLWHQGWHDGHASIVPSALTKLRTLESMRTRTAQNLEETRIAIRDGQVLGFSMLRVAELYQFYVSPQARGTGVALGLFRDAETHLRAAGHRKVWLDCAVGNDRAARFYAKAGWRNAGEVTSDLDTSEGHFALTVWRFEATL